MQRAKHRYYPAATKHAFNHIHGLIPRPLINAKIVAWLKKKERADVGALIWTPFSFLEKGEVSNHLKAMVTDEQTGGSCSHGHSRPAPREGRVTQTRKHI